jgi:spermidine synthase
MTVRTNDVGKTRQSTATGRVHVSLFCLIVLLSGASALIFETLWFYLCGLVFGNSVWASNAVLSSFMGGLALGNILVSRYGAAVRRYFAAYAAIEVVIGIAGVGLTLLLPFLTELLAPLFRPFIDVPWVINPLRFGTSFALLLVPTTAMGMTLPLLLNGVMRWEASFGSALGQLYGWNTLGAVAGVLSAEMLLVERYGIRGAAFVALLLNLLAAAMAVWVSRQIGEDSVGAVYDCTLATRGHRPRLYVAASTKRILFAAFLSGATLLALELVWFRFLSMFVVTGTMAFALMLSVVLAGIGLGGLIASRWLQRRPDAARHLPSLAFAAGGLLIMTYSGFRVGSAGYERAAEWSSMVFLCLRLFLPVSVVSGILFTLQGAAIKEAIPDTIRAAGWLTLANTVGSMVGALVAGFHLLPALGMEKSIFVLSLAYGAIAVLMAAPGFLSRRTLFVAAGAYCVCLFIFPFGLMRSVYLPMTAKMFQSDGSEIIAVREGRTETSLYLRKDFLGNPLYYRLITDGFSMTANSSFAQRYMSLYAYWPAAVHSSMSKALVMGFGMGVTAGAVTDIAALESIDVVDVSRDVLELSDIIYVRERHPLRDPRVKVYIEDGRYFLQTTSKRYDLITGEPPPPRRPGVVNLYTREYFQLIHDRLNEGGITTYWLPILDLLAEDTKAIIRAFCDVFPDCSMWNGTSADWMLVGSRGLPAAPPTEDHFTKQWRDPALGPKLRAIGLENPEQLGSLFIGDADYLQTLTAGTLPLADNYPKRLRPLFTNLGTERFDFYKQVLQVQRPKMAFVNSSVAKRYWPDSMREKTLRYFDAQGMINVLQLEGDTYYTPPRYMRAAYYILAQTPLRTAALWFLGTNPLYENALHHATDDGSGLVEYLTGLIAIADRDYNRAATYLAKAHEKAPSDKYTEMYRVFALAMAGRLDEARTLALSVRQPTTADEVSFWQWMRTKFGI